MVDVVEALTNSVNPRDYWYRMKIRVKQDEGVELSTFCRQLKLPSSDGKKYETDCANTEGIFRIRAVVGGFTVKVFKGYILFGN